MLEFSSGFYFSISWPIGFALMFLKTIFGISIMHRQKKYRIRLTIRLYMNLNGHNKLVSFFWSIADNCLRDVYVRGKYRYVILPMVVLRRLDVLSEETKQVVMDEVKFQRDEMELTELNDTALLQTCPHAKCKEMGFPENREEEE